MPPAEQKGQRGRSANLQLVAELHQGVYRSDSRAALLELHLDALGVENCRTQRRPERRCTTAAGLRSGTAARLQQQSHGVLQLELQLLRVCAQAFAEGLPSAGDPDVRAGRGKPPPLQPPLGPAPSEAAADAEERRTYGRVCVLSIDGGGIRGCIPARILARLEALLQQKSGHSSTRIADYFDLFAGTSVGGLLTVMLLTPGEDGRPKYTAEEACQFIEHHGALIFPQKLCSPLRAIKNILRPKYSARKYEALLETHLRHPDGNYITLKELLKPCMIPAWDCASASPQFFIQDIAKRLERCNYRLVDVCRSTSAAPTYFRPAPITACDGVTQNVCIDGGLVVNNPTLASTPCATSVAVEWVDINPDVFPDVRGRHDKGRHAQLQSKLILSIGTGEESPRYTYMDVRNWGQLAWVQPLIEIMFNSSSHITEYIVAAIMRLLDTPLDYFRIQVKKLPGTTKAMDNPTPKNVKLLFDLADEVLKEKATQMTRTGRYEELDHTNEERLSWFADQLINEHRSRLFRPRAQASSAFGQNTSMKNTARWKHLSSKQRASSPKNKPLPGMLQGL
eukprot:SM000007S20923  [mRNA]  locus=s7:1079816:1083340:+ [translate_table: standard]